MAALDHLQQTSTFVVLGQDWALTQYSLSTIAIYPSNFLIISNTLAVLSWKLGLRGRRARSTWCAK